MEDNAPCCCLWRPEAKVLIHPHTFLVLLHLLAFAIGLGSALLADWIVLTRLAFGTITQRAAQQLIDLSRGATVGLALLWITGAILVGSNALADPASLGNDKLWGKMLIVLILTLNALLLHVVVLPIVQSRVGHQLFDASFARQPLLCTLSGTVSATSWMFAAYLGCGRELNGAVSLGQVLSYYAATLVLVWGAALAIRPAFNIAASAPVRSIPGRLDPRPQ